VNTKDFYREYQIIAAFTDVEAAEWEDLSSDERWIWFRFNDRIRNLYFQKDYFNEFVDQPIKDE